MFNGISSCGGISSSCNDFVETGQAESFYFNLQVLLNSSISQEGAVCVMELLEYASAEHDEPLKRDTG